MITAEPHNDDRGYMRRLFDDALMEKAGLKMHCVQVSHSYVKKKYTVKGFHVALPPELEGKTVTVVRGKVMWVCIDVRKDSESFGQWESFELSGELNNSLYAPPGIAHGSITLTDDCQLVLRADNYFHQGTGIVWNDPDLNIDWPEKDPKKVIIRERDTKYPTFKEFKEKYGGV